MTTETEVTAAPAPVMVSSQREETDEIVETVDIEQPETKDYEDNIKESEDPRAGIYARHNEKRTQEIADGEELPIETGDPEAIIDGKPPAATPPDADEMVEIKVLGTVRSVSKAKIDEQGGVENYQIRAAAKEQMERNAHETAALARKQESLDEQERRLAEQTAALPTLDTQKGENPDRSTPTDGQNLEETARLYQEAMYDDSESAPALLVKLAKDAAAAGNTTFDKEAFRKQVRQDVLNDQRQAKIVKAGQTLIKAHPELQMRSDKFDRRMYENIDAETTIIARANPEMEPDEVVQEAYESISKWKGVTPVPETMSDKQAAKRAMARPRTGTQRYATPPPPPPPNNSDYVASERKRRGLD